MLLIGSVTIFIFIGVDHMILIVGLEDRLPISDTSTNTIIVTHNISELIEVLENVDSNTPIETSRL